jgi:hypothetical protein
MMFFWISEMERSLLEKELQSLSSPFLMTFEGLEQMMFEFSSICIWVIYGTSLVKKSWPKKEAWDSTYRN